MNIDRDEYGIPPQPAINLRELEALVRSGANIAVRATGMIQSHIAVCDERWEQKRKTDDAQAEKLDNLIDKVSRGFSSVYSRLWWMVGLGFTLMGSIILALLAKLLER